MKLRLLLTTALLITISSICTAQEAYAVYTPANKTLSFYYDNNRIYYDSNTNQMEAETFSLNDVHEEPEWIDRRFETVVFSSSFVDARPRSTYAWFKGQEDLKTVVGISNLNTKQVTDMAYMFSYCLSLTSLDVTHFDTSNVTDMSIMFTNCQSLKRLDVTHFDTRNVTSMRYLFAGCKSLTSLDVTHFDTRNVTNMSSMFSDCPSLTSLDVTHFNTSKVQSMNYMFNGCHSLTSLDVTHFDTSNVTDMANMFSYCFCENLDLSNFNTQKVNTYFCIFSGCIELSTIYVGHEWVIKDDARTSQMFRHCSKLVGGQGTAYTDVYDMTNTVSDLQYAHVDGGEDHPGFFTEKKYGLKVSNNVYEREVTSMNCNNILGTSSAVYNPRTHTLTLNGGTFGSYRRTAVTVTEDFDEDYSLNIELNGKNTLNSNPYYGIVSYRSLWITGNGSIKGDGINMVNGNLWINNCTLDVKSIHATNTEKAQGFWMRGPYAQVSLKSNIYGFETFDLEEDDGLMILVPENGYYDTVDQYVKDGYGNDITGGVVIGNPNGIATGIEQVQSAKYKDQSSKYKVQSSKFKVQSDNWYTIDGRKLSGKPNAKGVYIQNGKKIVVK